MGQRTVKTQPEPNTVSSPGSSRHETRLSSYPGTRNSGTLGLLVAQAGGNFVAPSYATTLNG
jgi:hypothetical protein